MLSYRYISLQVDILSAASVRRSLCEVIQGSFGGDAGLLCLQVSLWGQFRAHLGVNTGLFWDNTGLFYRRCRSLFADLSVVLGKIVAQDPAAARRRPSVGLF